MIMSFVSRCSRFSFVIINNFAGFFIFELVVPFFFCFWVAYIFEIWVIKRIFGKPFIYLAFLFSAQCCWGMLIARCVIWATSRRIPLPPRHILSMLCGEVQSMSDQCSTSTLDGHKTDCKSTNSANFKSYSS